MVLYNDILEIYNNINQAGLIYIDPVITKFKQQYENQVQGLNSILSSLL